MNKLRLDSVSLSYGRHRVLENVNVTVRAGDFLALVGENGSGKTTLMRAILGLHPLSGGEVHFDMEGNVGYMPQDIRYFGFFPASVEEVVLSGLAGKKLFYRPIDRRRMRALLEEFGLAARGKSSFHALSLGQRQKVLLARALMAEGDILLFDEPTASLDAAAREEFYDLLRDQNRKGLTIFLITHQLEEIQEKVSRVILLEDGTLRELRREGERWI